MSSDLKITSPNSQSAFEWTHFNTKIIRSKTQDLRETPQDAPSHIQPRSNLRQCSRNWGSHQSFRFQEQTLNEGQKRNQLKEQSLKKKISDELLTKNTVQNLKKNHINRRSDHIII